MILLLVLVFQRKYFWVSWSFRLEFLLEQLCAVLSPVDLLKSPNNAILRASFCCCPAAAYESSVLQTDAKVSFGHLSILARSRLMEIPFGKSVFTSV